MGTDLESALTEVTDTEAGIFKREGIEVDGAVAVIGLWGKGIFIKAEQIREVIIGDGITEPDVGEVIAAGGDSDDIIGIIGA